jgi:hypothetical protein
MLKVHGKPPTREQKMPNLTIDEAWSFIRTHGTEVDSKGLTRITFLENRFVVFTSEGWEFGRTSQKRIVEIVNRFVTMMAWHEICEARNQWSPAHVGYTVRWKREMGTGAQVESADKLEAYAKTVFDEAQMTVYRSALL